MLHLQQLGNVGHRHEQRRVRDEYAADPHGELQGGSDYLKTALDGGGRGECEEV